MFVHVLNSSNAIGRSNKMERKVTNIKFTTNPFTEAIVNIHFSRCLALLHLVDWLNINQTAEILWRSPETHKIPNKRIEYIHCELQQQSVESDERWANEMSPIDTMFQLGSFRWCWCADMCTNTTLRKTHEKCKRLAVCTDIDKPHKVTTNIYIV